MKAQLTLYNNNIINKTQLVPNAITVTSKEEALVRMLYPERRAESVLRCLNEGYQDEILLRRKDAEILINQRIGCNSPVCPVCTELKRKVTRKKLMSVVSQYKEPRFLTLSFKNTFDLSRDYLLSLSKQFHRFKFYLKRKGYVLGNYIAILEIKKTKSHGWNPHYHIIYDSTYIPKRAFSQVLKLATKGESYIIDVRSMSKGDRVRNRVSAMYYVTKYISKMNYRSDDFTDMITFYDSIKNIRFTKVYGIKPLKKEGLYIIYKRELLERGLDYHTVNKYVLDIQCFMNDNHLLLFELNLSWDENFYKNSSDQEFFKNLMEVVPW
jgi:transposase-like protein